MYDTYDLNSVGYDMSSFIDGKGYVSFFFIAKSLESLNKSMIHSTSFK